MTGRFCYTDDVAKAVNGVGKERLRAVISANPDADADETIGAIIRALAWFTGVWSRRMM